MTHQKQAPKTFVRFNGVLTPAAHPLSADLFTGGRRLDNATIEILAVGKQKAGSEFHNLDFKNFKQSEVEISTKIPGRPEVVIHWGKVAGYSMRHDDKGEVFHIVSRQEQHHFGDPLKSIPVWSHGTVVTTHKPLVFNEEIDGKIFYNRSPHILGGQSVFVDPESIRSALSQSYENTVDAEPWNIQTAAHFLCNWLNPNETYIKNPSFANLGILPPDLRLLRNHKIKYGLFLPLALDELLEPYGYSWFVFLSRGKRQIKVFKRGVGTVRTLLMQAPGSSVDMDKTNVEGVNLGFDVTSRAFNAVTVMGDYEAYEVTVELMPAWEAALDATDPADLQRDAEAWETDRSLSRVWRDWVLNEAGDYERYDFPRAFNLNSIFGKDAWYPHRRKFHPCITLGPDGAPIGQTGGIVVEWWNWEENAWLPLDVIGAESRHVRILERECGIRFDGAVIPWELYDQGADHHASQWTRVRVTATIIADRRAVVSKAADSSLIADLKEFVLDAPSRFKLRTVHYTSQYAAQVFAGTLKSTEVDDTGAMGALASELLDNWNQASIDGNVTLTGPGFNIQQTLGDPLGGVSGRNVRFSTNAAGSKFPTVVGLRLDFPQQTTTVTLDTYQREAFG